jgi:hypothetical protein
MWRYCRGMECEFCTTLSCLNFRNCLAPIVIAENSNELGFDSIYIG